MVQIPRAAAADECPKDAPRCQEESDGERAEIEHPRPAVRATAAADLPGGDLRLAAPISCVFRRDVVEVVELGGRDAPARVREEHRKGLRFDADPACVVAA
jgi:hypothetical protein